MYAIQKIESGKVGYNLGGMYANRWGEGRGDVRLLNSFGCDWLWFGASNKKPDLVTQSECAPKILLNIKKALSGFFYIHVAT